MARKSLLLVDADPRSLRVLEVSLRKAGYNLATASDGTTALSLIASSTPDLILSDTRLPGIDGFALVEIVRRNPDWGAIPIMFLSSDPAVESKVRGLQLGVEDYLTKPIYIKEIVARINIALSRFERENFARGGGRASISKTRFTGSLADMGLVDLMQTIEISRKSGVLEVHSGQRTGLMTFRDGQILDAELGSLHGERALYRVLLFSEGDFEIDFRPVKTEQQIRIPTQGLLMEGMRRLDEWGRLLEQIPPISSVMEINDEELSQRLAELPDEINAVLKGIDGQRSIEEVIDLVDGDDLNTLSTLSKLFFEGVIQPTGRSRTLRPPGTSPTGEVEGDSETTTEEDAHFETGVVPAAAPDSHAGDRANPDDPSTRVPTRASIVPASMPAEIPVPGPIDAEEPAIIASSTPVAEIETPPPAIVPAMPDEGTIDAPLPLASRPEASAPQTYSAKSTLIGPGFAALPKKDDDSAPPSTPAEHQTPARDSEDAMSKKNRKKNRGVEREVQKTESVRPSVEAKPVVAEPAVDKADAEAKKEGEAQSNVIQFPAKRSGVATAIAVNDDVQSGSGSSAARDDSTAPRLRTDDQGQDDDGDGDGDDDDASAVAPPRPLPGELPKVIVSDLAGTPSKSREPAAPPPSDRRSRREERRTKKNPTTTSGEIRALGTGDNIAVTDDFFRASQKAAAAATHDDFSDLGPTDELPKQSRQAMYATAGIVLGFGTLIGAFLYYQQMVLPPVHELGHAGPVELPHATTTPPVTDAPPPPDTLVDLPPDTSVAVAPDGVPDGTEVEALPPDDAAQVAEAEQEEIAALPPPEEVPFEEPAVAGETYESVLAEADAARRRPSTAIPLYERAIALNPVGSEALAQLSFLLLNRGRRPDLEQARDYAARASSTDPTNSLAWLVLGAARESLGDRAGAREAYHACVDQGQGAHVRECRALAH